MYHIILSLSLSPSLSLSLSLSLFDPLFSLFLSPLSPSGYTATILGLSNRSSATNSDCTIKVIPSLPQLRVRVFPQDDSTGTGGSKRNSTSSIGSTTKRRSITNLDNFELLDGEMLVNY